MPPRDRNDQSELVQDMLRDISDDVKELGKIGARHDESLKGLWHEIREEVKPSIRELGREQRELFSDHQEQCPALQAFFVKASSKDTPKPFRSIAPPSNGHKTLIYLATGIGVIATTIIVLLKKLGIF